MDQRITIYIFSIAIPQEHVLVLSNYVLVDQQSWLSKDNKINNGGESPKNVLYTANWRAPVLSSSVAVRYLVEIIIYFKIIILPATGLALDGMASHWIDMSWSGMPAVDAAYPHRQRRGAARGTHFNFQGEKIRPLQLKNQSMDSEKKEKFLIKRFSDHLQLGVGFSSPAGA